MHKAEIDENDYSSIMLMDKKTLAHGPKAFACRAERTSGIHAGEKNKYHSSARSERIWGNSR